VFPLAKEVKPKLSKEEMRKNQVKELKNLQIIHRQEAFLRKDFVVKEQADEANDNANGNN
jgi:hypothetical protein